MAPKPTPAAELKRARATVDRLTLRIDASDRRTAEMEAVLRDCYRELRDGYDTGLCRRILALVEVGQ